VFLRKFFSLVGIIAALALAVSSAAMAGNPNGVVLDAPKSVAVDYDHCWDASGTPLPCVSPEFLTTNNTSSYVACDIYVEELDFHISLGSIAPGTSAGGGLTAAYTGYKRLTFDLSCNGSAVNGETARIRILVN
jgi:hypothetical protein